MERVDVAVVGGGVVGLAAACAIADRGRSTCVLERHPRAGLESSTHNSGVIHAGIYYPAGSLKARLCVEGRDALYRFCAQHDIPHARCGKLIVCSRAGEIPALERLAARGAANGVDDLTVVDRRFVRTREPAIDACAALWSPSTGIVEAEALVRALARLAAGRDAYLLPGTPVRGGNAGRDGIELRTPAARRLPRGSWSTPPACTPTSCRPCSAASRSRSTRSGASTRSWRPAGANSSTASSTRCPTPAATAWAST